MAGATVEVDRFVGSAMTSVQVLTAANGTWSVSNVLGGRYRVRAWRAPFLALTLPQDLYLVDGHREVVNMNLDAYGSTAISSAMAPNPPMDGEPASLVVSVGAQLVGNDGVVRTTPEPGTLLNLLTGSQTSIDSANPLIANQAGQGAWALTCLSPGPQLVQITLDGGPPHTVPVPNCVAPPPTATTTTTSVPTTSAPTTTLSTQPPGG
ncbi:MAG: peptidase associated/transthyretin-like domain-containing protein [Acidimicrobiales bacterium]